MYICLFVDFYDKLLTNVPVLSSILMFPTQKTQSTSSGRQNLFLTVNINQERSCSISKRRAWNHRRGRPELGPFRLVYPRHQPKKDQQRCLPHQHQSHHGRGKPLLKVKLGTVKAPLTLRNERGLYCRPSRVNFSKRLHEKKGGPFARAKSQQQRSRMLCLCRLDRVNPGRTKVGRTWRVTLPWKNFQPSQLFCFSCNQFTKFFKGNVGKVGSGWRVTLQPGTGFLPINGA